MTKVVRTTRQGPGLTGRMLRRAVRLGVLAGAVLVGRKTARRTPPPGQDGQGAAARPQGPGAAAGGQAPPEHLTGQAAPTDPGRGRQAEQPQQIPARGWKDIALRVKDEVKQDQVPLLAAGVAFYAILSLFPAVIAAVSIYGIAADPATVRRQIEQLTRLLSPETATILTQQIEQITRGAGGALGLATVLGIATALWSASSGMKALITGVNLAYGESESRKFFKLRGLALLLTLGAMVLMGVALVLIVAFPAVTNDWPTALRWTASILRWLVLAVLLVIGLAVLYRFAADRDNPRWSWVSWGSVVATVLWVAASLAFSFYVSAFGNYNKTYGALAGIIILLFWLFLTAFMVLLGAELNTEMELQTAKDTTAGPEKPIGERQAHAADHVAAAP
ncbi:MAG TPA: YihY/virulence factor BrkB family protein [Actinomycetota bacterium]|nr:YihY/virulence factor BrkB family protein [Actinomycetota bacterium]